FVDQREVAMSLTKRAAVGLVFGGRFNGSELAHYIVAQVLGAIAAGAELYFIAIGKPGFELGGFAANGYGEHSIGRYSLAAGGVTEIVMTSMFLFVSLGATDKRAPPGVAPTVGAS